MSIPRDVQEFLDGYPGVDDDPAYRENFEFYSNDIRCIPDNRTIQEIHERLPSLHSARYVVTNYFLGRWFGDYDRLEYKHGYIENDTVALRCSTICSQFVSP